VTAAAQTAGRGRLGRAWQAPAGSSVLASVIVRGLDERRAELLPLTAAVGVCEACERFVAVRCVIKWPNDVWIEGHKVAGILLEGRPQEGWAVVGIGINVATRPDELPEDLPAAATSLAIAASNTAGHEPPPPVEGVTTALAAGLEQWLAAPSDELLAAWSARDALRGRRIRWDGGEGIAEGIDASGALIVASDGGRIELHAGEVGLVRPSGGSR
jgi:BirA family biotin operon repressor/biotin-[acetyl-CoA-carboxylase] ligase